MDTYTCITEVRGAFHLTQHAASDPVLALRDHIAALPYDDATGPFDEELDWLRSISSGLRQVELHPLSQCKNTWLWGDGARFNPQYISYIVKTDLRQ